MVGDPALYAHRRNEEGSYDSICRTCFTTVVRSKSEAELAEHEKSHLFDPSLAAERGCYRREESIRPPSVSQRA